MIKIGVIGGGASGFFCAINIKIKNPSYKVVIYEKSNKTLSKVKISGGGRCNVTNAEIQPKNFLKNYPRGENFLKKNFSNFKNTEVITWFAENGVALKAEPDGRIFPKSNDSQAVIDCFWTLCKKLDIEVMLNARCTAIHKFSKGLEVELNNNQRLLYDKVVVCMGGGSQRSHYETLAALGHHIITPLPSLFTFNLIDKSLSQLMGLVAKNVYIKIINTNFDNEGDLLITHWGLSGPAVIKLSAFAAQTLHERQYQYDVKVNWVNIKNEELVREKLNLYKNQHPQKVVFKNPLFELPHRLWEYLCRQAEIADHTRWVDLSAKCFNKLVDQLTNSIYKCKGKTTFKEEFVTCGGIDLDEVDPQSMQSKLVSGLYFAGEVINIDGVTGGYNFQNAWTTAYIAAQAV
ncbi:MAG TPA: NAD(P)/FAD-dependent oxidoreductase [Cytophagales bacterium]|nr:NAD(P)/FAD-dependent oxidoreductase [Cytophagales bacterium]